MSTKNLKIKKYIPTFTQEYLRYADSSTDPTLSNVNSWVSTNPDRYVEANGSSRNRLKKVRSLNINRGSLYPNTFNDSNVVLQDSNSTYTPTQVVESARLTSNNVLITFSASGYEVFDTNDWSKAWLEASLDYFYTELQEYSASQPLYGKPKDFEIVRTSPYEIESVIDTVLLVFIGSGCIEILTRKSQDIYGNITLGDVFHRFLSEGWESKYGSDILKQFYTDINIGDNATDFIQSNENRNSALSAIAPVVLENTGFDIGNISNTILENLKFYYYTKPLESSNQYAFTTVYSFDGGSGSAYNETQYREIYAKNISSIINDKNNIEPALHNVFFEVPQELDDFDYVYFSFDFSTLLNLKDSRRSIASYINNNYTGANFDEDAALTKIGNVIFDSIGLFDLRYYDQKLDKWMSTNIVSGSYYVDLYGDTGELYDPLLIVRSCVEADGYTSATIITAPDNYNPFYDYANSSITIYSNSDGSLDYKNVVLKLAIKEGFKTLVVHDNISCNEKTHLNYALTAIDQQFEIEDKSVIISEAYGKKLLWLAVPPIVQHVNASGGVSLAQFKIVDDIFGPSDLTLAYGAPLYGKFPLDILRILKSIWIE
jgi:hypothetical protein